MKHLGQALCALFVLAALLLIPITQSHAAAPKAGAKCSKLNATSTYGGKKYTCIKNGKKLVWNKGVAVAKPIPSPTPTPMPSPTVTPPIAIGDPSGAIGGTPTPTPTPTPTLAPLTLAQMSNDLLHPTAQLKNCLYSALTEADIAAVFAMNPNEDVQQKIMQCHYGKVDAIAFAPDSVRAVAYQQILNRYTANTGKVGKLTADIDPALFQAGQDSVIAGLNDAMQFWGADILPEARAIIGGKDQWLLDTLCAVSNLKDSAQFKTCAAGPVSNLGAGSGWPPTQSKLGDMWGAVFGPYQDPTNTFRQSAAYGYLSVTDPAISNTSFQAAAVHEFTHLAQWNSYYLTGTSSERAAAYQTAANAGQMNWKLVMRPTLWTEGSASYFGSAVANIKNPDALASTVEVKPSWATGSAPKVLDLINYALNVSCPCTTEQIAERQKVMDLQYWAGAAMTELLVAQFGIDKTVSMMTELGVSYTDLTSTWDAVFKKNYGVDWSSWAQVSDLYIADLWVGNPTPLSKYNVTFPHIATVPLTPELKSVTAGANSVRVQMYGYDKNADPITKIVATTDTGASCEITTIQGSCVITGLKPDVQVSIKAQAFNAVGGSEISWSAVATPYAATPVVKSILVSADPWCRDPYAWEAHSSVCLIVDLAFEDAVLGAKTSATIDLGFGEISLRSGSNSIQGFTAIKPAVANLGLSNEYTLTTRLGQGDIKIYKGSFDMLPNDLVPTKLAPVAKDLGNGSVTISWSLSPAQLGKGFTYEVAEVHTSPDWNVRAVVVASGISDTTTSITLPKSTYTAGTVAYVIRIEKTATTLRGTSTLTSNIVA